MGYLLFTFSKKIESLGKMTAMTQEEIVAAVRTVAQGLEALRSEHAGILHGLHDAPDQVANERAGLVQQSAEMIELGLGEAQVINCVFKTHNCGPKILVLCDNFFLSY